MTNKLHTSSQTQAIFTSLSQSLGLQPYILSKLAIALSIKKALPKEEESKPKRPAGDRPRRSQPHVWTGTQRSEPENMSFEDMMARFKTVSDEKMSDLKKNSAAKRGTSAPRRGGNQRG